MKRVAEIQRIGFARVRVRRGVGDLVRRVGTGHTGRAVGIHVELLARVRFCNLNGPTKRRGIFGDLETGLAVRRSQIGHHPVAVVAHRASQAGDVRNRDQVSGTVIAKGGATVKAIGDLADQVRAVGIAGDVCNIVRAAIAIHDILEAHHKVRRIQ